ncbi:MAG: exo-alpha-sialidase [Acidobacteria bacterium]|nr:exo-alpha-sialidase [Acidobacteriota bacterium]
MTGALVFVTAVTLAVSCGRTDPADWRVTIEPLALPSGPDSSEPQLTMSDRGVLVSWIERTGPATRLRFAERTASGWTDPVDAAAGEGWFLSYADVPSVLRLSDGTLVAQWLENTEELLEAYDLHLSYSTDNGRTWAPSFLPHHDGTKTQHGFASVFELPGRALGLVWLDGRAAELDATDPEGGAMSLRYAAFDANWKQTADVPIDLRVCECCPTTAVVTPDGVLTAFRDRSETEIRDISVSRLENGAWTLPTTVHDDNWEIPACPVNGPMLSARGRNVAVAWFTVKDDQGQAYAAFSTDAGRSWGAPIRLDEAGALGRVDIELLDDGSAVAAWVEFADQRAQFRIRRVEPSGVSSPPVTVAGVSDARTSGYPRLARQGGELVFAWAESASGGESGEGGLQVRTARATLP